MLELFITYNFECARVCAYLNEQFYLLIDCSIKWKTKNTTCTLSEQFRSQSRRKRHNLYPNTQIYNCSLSCLGTGTLIKCGGTKLVLWTQTSPQVSVISAISMKKMLTKI